MCPLGCRGQFEYTVRHRHFRGGEAAFPPRPEGRGLHAAISMNTPMRIPMTEYLEIDLETERWRCRRCAHDLGPARGNYKEGTLVYDRDPSEIHRPLIDPGRYEFTFAPDPAWCRILDRKS